MWLLPMARAMWISRGTFAVDPGYYSCLSLLPYYDQIVIQYHFISSTTTSRGRSFAGTRSRRP